MSARAIALRWLSAAALLPGAARAQQAVRPTFRPLVRADAIVARASALQAGVGVALAAGTYLRVEGTVAGGASRRAGATTGGGRVDLVARFLLDPFAQTAVGSYVGGGLSARADGGDPNAHVFLLVLLGVEGRRRGRVYPSAELGLGGGTRIGIVLRAAPASGR